MKNVLLAWLTGLLLVGQALALVQPTAVPGRFDIPTVPAYYPALQEIINKPAPALPVY